MDENDSNTKLKCQDVKHAQEGTTKFQVVLWRDKERRGNSCWMAPPNKKPNWVAINFHGVEDFSQPKYRVQVYRITDMWTTKWQVLGNSGTISTRIKFSFI